jgi:hypothetical protein
VLLGRRQCVTNVGYPSLIHEEISRIKEATSNMKSTRLRSVVSVMSLALATQSCVDDEGAPSSSPRTDTSDGSSSETQSETRSTDSSSTNSDTRDTTSDDESTSADASTSEPGQTNDTTSERSATTNPGDDTSDVTDSPAPDCPDVDDRDPVDVPSEITKDTTWSCDKVYRLPSQPTVVAPGATLKIEPGVEIWGQEGSALVIARGSKINANGHPDAPIVFTSGLLPGERAPGNWGGVLLLGGAPINDPGGEVDAEGIDPTKGYSKYGGDDEDYDCGSMSYVRIEFGGYELSPDNELNNLGVAGCGKQTVLHHIQVHAGSDDGIEFWGGAPVVHHIVASSNSDDSFDWASGFSSNVQFVVIQQNEADGDTAFEADGHEESFKAEPRANPTFYNVTAIGGTGAGDSIGAVLRRGTYGKFYNSLFMGFGTAAIDVRDPETVEGAQGEKPELTIENSWFYNNGPDGKTHFPDEQATDNDDGFDEAAYFSDEAKSNVFDTDPKLTDPTNLTEPNFVPAKDSKLRDSARKPPAGFDSSAQYAGAFAPGGSDWTAGWTAYPKN